MNIKKRAAVILAAVIAALPAVPASAGEPDKAQPVRVTSENSAYNDYISESGLKDGSGDISASVRGETVLDEGKSGEWSFTLDSAALYSVELTYLPADENVTDIEISFETNGTVPFEGLDDYVLNRVWVNDPDEMDGDSFKTDIYGNQSVPAQIQSDEAVINSLRDTSGNTVTPYRFAFAAGENVIKITSVRNAVEILKVRIYASGESGAVSYEEYSSSHGGADYKGETLLVEGEAADRKSASNLVPGTDRSSPATSPSDPAKTMVNTIGSDGWTDPGQWIEWTVNVPEDGVYAIGIKFRQNFVSGMAVTRSLYINGEIPFSEAGELEFPYSGKWQASLISDSEGQPYGFYLKKGDNTIRLEVCLGDAAYYYQLGRESVEELNTAYQQIIMLTGTDPDELRNYRIDKNCPEAMEIFKEQVEVLNTISGGLEAAAGKKGSINTSIDNLRLQLESLLDDPISIASRIDTLRTNITGYADSIYSLAQQPLEIDYLVFSSPDGGVPEEISDIGASFAERVAYEFKAFISSFVTDYSSLSGGSSSADALKVWTSLGREQATVLKKLIDNDFTESTGIPVELKIIPSSSGISPLLLATVSGKGPDAAVGLANSDAVNYAIRGAAEELSKFDGFDDAVSGFYESAMTPFYYNGGVYGMPLTQTFYMMFYREDILESLSLDVPENWDDMYTVIGELQKKNMTVGIGTDLNWFATRIYQSGGSLYNDEKTASLFDSTVSMNVFKEWCNLFTSYNLPIDYDGANRFRTGEMPIVIADYSFYNTISVLAPEIKGSWSFCGLPYGELPDGSLSNVSASGGTCSIMLSSASDKEGAWEFLRWLSSDEIQSRYGRDIESRLGVASRYQTANYNAAKDIPWTASELERIYAQWENTEGIPEVPGSYYVARNINNALRNVVSYGNDPQEVLKEYTITINDEIETKIKQYSDK